MAQTCTVHPSAPDGHVIPHATRTAPKTKIPGGPHSSNRREPAHGPAVNQLPNCWHRHNSSSQFGSKRFSALTRLHHLGFLERPRESQSAQSFLSPAMWLICNCTRCRAQKMVVDCSTSASGRFIDRALSLAPVADPHCPDIETKMAGDGAPARLRTNKYSPGESAICWQPPPAYPCTASFSICHLQRLGCRVAMMIGVQ